MKPIDMKSMKGASSQTTSPRKATVKKYLPPNKPQKDLLGAAPIVPARTSNNGNSKFTSAGGAPKKVPYSRSNIKHTQISTKARAAKANANIAANKKVSGSLKKK